ncbi:hypothetical protein HN51_024706 [Arachis hypogaea]|uniref:Peroxidase n=2 Tax=Arachis TaxID=3817 RepID=A0A445C7C1_ARAHY|nr:peroxidase P7 [Arachis duranensis]XP_025609636.1 peroxidase P7 [Arachis hypogaea]QHO27762.1 Peroxidase [Arachis hypogaea]RYR46830.1 hypothetical protein Ahy_A07g032670 [Arachis hypogaea]
MAPNNLHQYIISVVVIVSLAIFLNPTYGEDGLSPDYYKGVCPQALPTVRAVVRQAIDSEPRNGAFLLHLHFHDCFVNGCDGSVLLDDTPEMKGEKTATPNNNSLRAFDVVDEIKAAVDKACNGPLVSCADILALAARDSVFIMGGKQYYYKVLLGRRDATSASIEDANNHLPLANADFSDLLGRFFQPNGLNLKDMVVLSGAHTIGFAKCDSFKARLYNDTNIDSNFATSLKQSCPPSGGSNLTALDVSTASFDNNYYSDLLQNKGVLHSDQELYKGDGCESDQLVKLYNSNPNAFAKDFATSMVKMGKIKPLLGNQGEIRSSCRKTNRGGYY